jgi:type II secretory pathway component PulM
MATEAKGEGELKKELAVREEILPVERKLVAGSIILAIILLVILYWVSWSMIAHV